MEEGIQNSKVVSQKRDNWKRLRNSFAALSAFSCLAAAVAWGFGIAGWGWTYISPQMRENVFATGGVSGSLMLYFDKTKKLRVAAREGFEIQEMVSEYDRKIWVLPSLGLPEEFRAEQMFLVCVPYWLLILLFAIAPALWLRRSYVERRDKKFFAEIVAAKRAEQAQKEKP